VKVDIHSDNKEPKDDWDIDNIFGQWIWRSIFYQYSLFW
jgi:hypothetical protein